MRKERGELRVIQPALGTDQNASTHCHGRQARCGDPAALSSGLERSLLALLPGVATLCSFTITFTGLRRIGSSRFSGRANSLQLATTTRGARYFRAMRSDLCWLFGCVTISPGANNGIE